MTVRLLLGPQRPRRYLGEALTQSAIGEGSLAIIAAGWQEGEVDVSEVEELVGRPLENLRLWQRAENVFEERPSLRELYRERQDRLVELQRLYRRRLKHVAIAARSMMRIKDENGLVADERQHAVDQVRALDRHHLDRVEAIHRDYEGKIVEAGGNLLQRHADEIRAELARHRTLVITGGNVAILQNRMRLFGVHRMIREHALLAWSAGAMILSHRIVLYHDNTPEGRRDAEVFGAGFGLLPGFVFFPDTDQRLQTKRTRRVELLARRFAPDLCVSLNNGTVLEHDGKRVARSVGLQRLRDDGVLEELEAA
ncbi:MAG: Type 1 glutamine amidotransferase-like domain-containing protein [Myxococcota bacterium]